jgi:hypothetical protein
MQWEPTLAKDSSWNQIMQYSFLHVFANDATIDAHEMAMLERLALKDGQVDDHERAVLSRVFGRVDRSNVSVDVWSEINRFKTQYRNP